VKGVIAVVAVCALALLTTLALYQFVRWLAAVRMGGGALSGLRDPELMRLEDEKRRLLNHLREIRFDYQTGKLDASDYRALRDRAEREAAAILEAIEIHGQGRPSGRPG
jgi:hypothetical protein